MTPLSALNLLDASAPLFMLTSHLSLFQSDQTVSIDAKCDEPSLLGNVLDEIKQTFSKCWLWPLTAQKPPEPPHAQNHIPCSETRVPPLWTFVFIGSFSVLLFRPQISSPSLAFVSPPQLCLTCIWSHTSSCILRLSDTLSIVLTVHEIHLDWELDFFIVDAWVVCFSFFKCFALCCLLSLFFCPELHQRLSLH